MSENSQYKKDKQLLLDHDLSIHTVYQVRTGNGLVLTQRANERGAITDAAFAWRKILGQVKRVAEAEFRCDSCGNTLNEFSKCGKCD